MNRFKRSVWGSWRVINIPAMPSSKLLYVHLLLATRTLASSTQFTRINQTNLTSPVVIYPEDTPFPGHHSVVGIYEVSTFSVNCYITWPFIGRTMARVSIFRQHSWAKALRSWRLKLSKISLDWPTVKSFTRVATQVKRLNMHILHKVMYNLLSVYEA